jgi:hypothetical protein
MFLIDWAHFLLVAAMGASLTTALRTGSLAPFFPGVRRADAPFKFWLGIAFYSWFVIGFLGALVWVALRR